MTQGYEQGSYGPGSYEPGSGQYEPAPTPSLTGPRRARVGLIALVAFLLELIIIAAGANQAVTKHLESYVNDHNPNSFVTSMVRAVLVFSWRLTPRHGDTGHVWLSDIVNDVGVLVLTVLLILAIARGPITWGRAFFGIWMTVIVSTCLAAILALLVTKGFAPPGVDKATYAVFSGPTGDEFFAGAALGLVVALITSIVAIATRRPGAVIEAAYAPHENARTAPEPPPPYYGDAAPTAWSQPTSNQPTSNQPTSNQPMSNQPMSNQPTSDQPGPSARSESPTTAYPVVPAGPPPSASPPTPAGPPTSAGPAQSEPTTTLPRFDGGWQPGQRSGEAAGEPAGEPVRNESVTSQLPKAELPTTTDDRPTTEPRFTGGETGTWPSQPTAAFPLPPDDEDLGQHPEHD